MQIARELERVRVGAVAEGSRLAWASGRTFALPAAVISQLGACFDRDGLLQPKHLAPSSARVDTLRLRAAFTETPPASSRLPFSYQRVPARLRDLVAGGIGRLQRRRMDRWAHFPAFPIDLSSDFLADLLATDVNPFASGPTPVVLSHDLDSGEGLVNFLHWFAGIEETFGARSSNYVVPFGSKLDEGLLQDLVDRGHEVGVHGYDHSNQTAFLPPDQQASRLRAAFDRLAHFRPRGYRAPSLLRTRSLLRALSAVCSYDSSIPTAGGLFPVPNNGCASARPFVCESVPELPLSMPRDGSLLFLGFSPIEIERVWKESAREIRRASGVIVLLTHCEARFSGNGEMLAAYRELLQHFAESDDYEFSTPAAVLARAGLSPARAIEEPRS